MRRKLLCLDLDGTLLDDRGVLGEATAATLNELRRRGHVVSFVTGRGEIDMLRCGDMLRCADYLLLGNGGKLLDLSSGAVRFHEKPSDQTAQALAAYCLREGLQLYVMMGRRYVVTELTPGVEEYAREAGIRPTILTAPEELPSGAVESFMSAGDGERVAGFIREAGLPLRCLGSEPGCCDIMPDTAGKWNGVRRLAELLGIPAEDVLAAGNYDNDIEMLCHAGVGVAVANALDQVKACADYVTARSNNEDAVVEIAQVFFWRRGTIRRGWTRPKELDPLPLAAGEVWKQGAPSGRCLKAFNARSSVFFASRLLYHKFLYLSI